MLKRIHPILTTAFVLACAGTHAAVAAQPAMIEMPGTELKEGPGATFRTIAKLDNGQLVAASNLPLEGFYKVRTPQGQVGWVATDRISSLARNAATGAVSGAAPGGAAETNAGPGDDEVQGAQPPAAPEIKTGSRTEREDAVQKPEPKRTSEKSGILPFMGI